MIQSHDLWNNEANAPLLEVWSDNSYTHQTLKKFRSGKL